jgi:CRP-like cAMP-binding protein
LLCEREKLDIGLFPIITGKNMNNSYDQLIKYITPFAVLSPVETEQLRKMFFLKMIKKGECFLKAGDHVKYLGFNNKGIFRYFYIDYEGNDKTKYFVSRNDFIFSLSSFINKAPSLYFIEALEDSEVLLASADDVRELLKSNVMWQNLYRNILEGTYIIKEKRESEFLLYDAKQRYLNFTEEYPEIHKSVKQHHIASFLGIAPESLSRIRSQLEIS